jgi:hypothetical protein
MDHAFTSAAAWQRRADLPDALVRLGANATLARDLAVGASIAVHSGRVWVTQAGDANDYVVDAGERHVVTQRGRVVIESFTAQATLRLLHRAPAARVGFP